DGAETCHPERRQIRDTSQRRSADGDPREKRARSQHNARDERDVVPTHGLLRVFEFLVPGHLNGLELGLVRRLRVVVEPLEAQDAFAEIREATRQRIEVRIFLQQGHADVFSVLPFHRVTSWPGRSFLSDLPSWMPPPSWT